MLRQCANVHAKSGGTGNTTETNTKRISHWLQGDFKKETVDKKLSVLSKYELKDERTSESM